MLSQHDRELDCKSLLRQFKGRNGWRHTVDGSLGLFLSARPWFQVLNSFASQGFQALVKSSSHV